MVHSSCYNIYPCAIIISTGAVHIHVQVLYIYMYSRFRGFSHSAITHVILVLERWTPMHDCAIGI